MVVGPKFQLKERILIFWTKFAIQHIRISLRTKFFLKKISLIFGPNYPKNGI